MHEICSTFEAGNGFALFLLPNLRKTNMKIGIIVAMQSELECVRCLLENPREEQHGSSLFIIGTNGKHELILTQSGIGKVSSAIRTYELIDRYAPDCILNTGVAGGIDRSMHVMDIVVGSEIVYHDVWCGEGCAWGQIDGLPARFHSERHWWKRH